MIEGSYNWSINVIAEFLGPKKPEEINSLTLIIHGVIFMTCFPFKLYYCWVKVVPVLKTMLQQNAVDLKTVVGRYFADLEIP